jgi:hypothetical protein
MQKVTIISAMSALLGLASTAHAADAFSVGAIVKPTTSDPDPVCRERVDAAAYHSANDACAFGSADDCDAAKHLETSGRCGAHNSTYIVVSVDNAAGLMKISPTNDSSVFYWAFADDFSAD